MERGGWVTAALKAEESGIRPDQAGHRSDLQREGYPSFSLGAQKIPGRPGSQRHGCRPSVVQRCGLEGWDWSWVLELQMRCDGWC